MSKAQLSRLIDLPDEALQQVIDYASTLSKPDAVEHFKNLLGDSPMAIEYISAFNSHRPDPTTSAGPSTSLAMPRTSSAGPSPAASAPSSDIDAVPKRTRGPKKKKAPLHTPPARQVTTTLAPPGAAYNKKDRQEDYISGRSGGSTPASLSRSQTPVSSAAAASSPFVVPPSQQPPKQLPTRPAGGAGSLIQDALQPKTKKSSSASSSGTAASKKTKVAISGGTAMHGAATALAAFDSAIRALEISTNPTLAASSDSNDVAARRCNCVATRHPLQTAAPNCQHCGKVVCVKEGLGPCTFCGKPLLSAAEVQAMIKELRAERGREKMAADKAAHRRPDANNGPSRPTMIAGTTKWGNDDDFVSLEESARAAAAAAAAAGHRRGNSGDLRSAKGNGNSGQREAEAKARAHRDRLLAFQSENAQRTTVRDEAADFDVGDALAAVNSDGLIAGKNMWASPAERARALQQQQKRLREQEWNARPEYEKRQQVLSIDLAGKKVFSVKKAVAAVSRPPSPTEEEVDDERGWAAETKEGNDTGGGLTEGDGNRPGGAFSKNPLLGKLIKPVYEPRARKEKKGKGKGKGKQEEEEEEAADEAGGEENRPAVLFGRKDDPNAASRWRRVQDDLDDNEAVILDGGLYGTAAPTKGDEPE